MSDETGALPGANAVLDSGLWLSEDPNWPG